MPHPKRSYLRNIGIILPPILWQRHIVDNCHTCVRFYHSINGSSFFFLPQLQMRFIILQVHLTIAVKTNATIRGFSIRIRSTTCTLHSSSSIHISDTIVWHESQKTTAVILPPFVSWKCIRLGNLQQYFTFILLPPGGESYCNPRVPWLLLSYWNLRAVALLSNSIFHSSYVANIVPPCIHGVYTPISI